MNTVTDPSFLSKRETGVLRLVACGKSNKQVAAELFISEKTVEKHRYALMKKLGIHSIAALVIYALEKNFITPDPPELLDCPLTHREKEILELIAMGLSNKLIADRLRIAFSTVCCHRGNLHKKFRHGQRDPIAGLVHFAFANSMVRFPTKEPTVVYIADRLLETGLEEEACIGRVSASGKDIVAEYQNGNGGQSHVVKLGEARLWNDVVNRLKIMSGIETTVQKRLQIGMIELESPTRSLRLVCLPTSSGVELVVDFKPPGKHARH